MAREILSRGESFGIGDRWTNGQVITTEAAFHAWFMEGLNKKINTFGGILAERGAWRKWSDEYYIRFWRDQRSLRQILTQRYRIYQFETKEVGSRFGHLLADPYDI
jgi:hypothetical protein